MKPRLISLVACLFALSLVVARAQADDQANNRPNILFILIDDISDFSLPCYGARTMASNEGFFKDVPLSVPNIDRLADSGVVFEEAYVYAICEPTRVSLMSGMHNGRNYVYPKAVHESQITFSDVLQRAGYTTGIFGKWKQSRGTPDHEAATYLERLGWDDYLCFDVVDQGYRFLEPRLVHNGQETLYKGHDPATGRRWYGPDICNRGALKFLEDRKADDAPFFLYYSMLLVHDEHTPTPDTRPKDKYDNFDMKTKTEFGHLKGDDRRYFPDMLAYTDKMIGRVLDKLDALGLTDDTVVILMGDNGVKACFEFTAEDGTVRRGGKGFNRDKGEHVPLIFSWPAGIDRGDGRYAGIFDATDFYPTVLDICGVALPNPDKIDGVSVWPYITGQADGHHRQSIYKWYNHNQAHQDLTNALGYAQTPDFKLYAPHDIYPRGRFFDLRTDREEAAGAKGKKIRWEHHFHAGLDLDNLTPEQQDAFDRLSKVLAEKAYTPVKALDIFPARVEPLRVGARQPLVCHITPSDATKNNVVWVSSDSSVASIDKFGEVTAHKPGTVDITVYSWDDADVMAAGPRKAAYRTDGIRDVVKIRVAG